MTLPVMPAMSPADGPEGLTSRTGRTEVTTPVRSIVRPALEPPASEGRAIAPHAIASVAIPIRVLCMWVPLLVGRIRR